MQCSYALKNVNTDKSADAAGMWEVIWMGFELREVVSVTCPRFSKTEPLVIQDNRNMHEDCELQYRPSSFGAFYINLRKKASGGSSETCRYSHSSWGLLKFRNISQDCHHKHCWIAVGHTFIYIARFSHLVRLDAGSCAPCLCLIRAMRVAV